MRLHDLSLKTSAMIIIVPDGIIVFSIPRFQTRNLFAQNIAEDAQIVMMILPFNVDRSSRTLAYVARNNIGYLVVSVLISLMII